VNTTPLEPRRRGRPPGIAKGYRRRPSGGYQIRVAGFPSQVAKDELVAMLRVAELRILKRDGNFDKVAGELRRLRGEQTGGSRLRLVSN
jgi:hypothetical protein